MSTEVRTERIGGTLLITIDRPKARNAVNAAVAAGLAEALDTLEADPGLRAASSPAPTARSAPAWTSRPR